MAPKGLSPSQKQQRALTYLRQSRTCHTLKDLEKALPSVASVNSVAVKDLIKELIDESKINVDKIGNGNWYWIFPSEEKREKVKTVKQLEAEKETVQTSIQNLQERRNKMNADKAETQANDEHQDLLRQLDPLRDEVNRLGHELDGLNDAVAGSVDRLKGAITVWKQEATCWTNDIYILEAFFKDVGILDWEAMEILRKECYGTDYVEGEGLQDLEDI